MPFVGDLDDEDGFEGQEPQERHYDDLSNQEKQILMNIKTVGDIKSCEVISDWNDDHQICVGVNLNGVVFGAWWIGWETAGAFRYWDSPTAKQEIVDYLRQASSNAEDPMGDEITPEDLPQ